MAKGSKAVHNIATLTLAALVAATNDKGFMFASKEAAQPFIDAGTGELNTDMPNPDNATEFALRATDKGKTEATNGADTGTTTAPTPAPAASTKPTFEIETGAQPPAKERGGNPGIYPFDDLPAPAGDGSVARFFVPASQLGKTTADDAKKAMNGNVSTANRRYGRVVGTNTFKKADGSDGKRDKYEYDRQFVAATGEKNGAPGVYVSRVK